MLMRRTLTMLRRRRLPPVCNENPRSWVSWADVETSPPEGQPPVGERRPPVKAKEEPDLNVDVPPERKPPVIRRRGDGPMELGG
jgi:hypothetical protein